MKTGFYKQIQNLEIQLLTKTLKKTNGNKTQAAKLLNLNRTTLIMKCQKYEIK